MQEKFKYRGKKNESCIVFRHTEWKMMKILPAASHWSSSDLLGRSPSRLWGSAPPRTRCPTLRLQRRWRAAAVRRGAPRWAAWSSAWSWCAAACGPFPVSNKSLPRAKHLFIWLLPSARSTLSFDFFFLSCVTAALGESSRKSCWAKYASKSQQQQQRRCKGSLLIT